MTADQSPESLFSRQINEILGEKFPDQQKPEATPVVATVIAKTPTHTEFAEFLVLLKAEHPPILNQRIRRPGITNWLPRDASFEYPNNELLKALATDVDAHYLIKDLLMDTVITLPEETLELLQHIETSSWGKQLTEAQKIIRETPGLPINYLSRESLSHPPFKWFVDPIAGLAPGLEISYQYQQLNATTRILLAQESNNTLAANTSIVFNNGDQNSPRPFVLAANSPSLSFTAATLLTQAASKIRF